MPLDFTSYVSDNFIIDGTSYHTESRSNPYHSETIGGLQFYVHKRQDSANHAHKYIIEVFFMGYSFYLPSTLTKDEYQKILAQIRDIAASGASGVQFLTKVFIEVFEKVCVAFKDSKGGKVVASLEYWASYTTRVAAQFVFKLLDPGGYQALYIIADTTDPGFFVGRFTWEAFKNTFFYFWQLFEDYLHRRPNNTDLSELWSKDFWRNYISSNPSTSSSNGINNPSTSGSNTSPSVNKPEELSYFQQFGNTIYSHPFITLATAVLTTYAAYRAYYWWKNPNNPVPTTPSSDSSTSSSSETQRNWDDIGSPRFHIDNNPVVNSNDNNADAVEDNTSDISDEEGDAPNLTNEENSASYVLDAEDNSSAVNSENDMSDRSVEEENVADAFDEENAEQIEVEDDEDLQYEFDDQEIVAQVPNIAGAAADADAEESESDPELAEFVIVRENENAADAFDEENDDQENAGVAQPQIIPQPRVRPRGFGLFDYIDPLNLADTDAVERVRNMFRPFTFRR